MVFNKVDGFYIRVFIYYLKIARHGDRTPMRKNQFYKSNETQWQKYGGYEMLTRMGIQHCYEFGAFLKNFYANFLGNNVTFDPSKVFIRTTFLERAIRSAKAVMAGIFNLNNSQPLLPMNISTKKFDKVCLTIKLVFSNFLLTNHLKIDFLYGKLSSI